MKLVQTLAALTLAVALAAAVKSYLAFEHAYHWGFGDGYARGYQNARDKLPPECEIVGSLAGRVFMGGGMDTICLAGDVELMPPFAAVMSATKDDAWCGYAVVKQATPHNYQWHFATDAWLTPKGQERAHSPAQGKEDLIQYCAQGGKVYATAVEDWER